MARGHDATNTDEAGLALKALGADPPGELFVRRLELRRQWSVILLNLLSVVLLTVSFAPFDCWYLAYVALVPWCMALAGVTGQRRWGLLWAWLAGLMFWCVNLYWLTWITLVGYAALSLYLSAYWLVAAVVVRAALRRNWPTWIVLPVLWVALEYARAYVISGLPWFFLAHSQYRLATLIQISDVTGQYGVSFFVAMVNGALLDLLVSPLFVRTGRGPVLRRQGLAGALATIIVLGGLICYGQWRIRCRPTRPGPAIGIVQHAFPISLFEGGASEAKMLDSHLESSKRFVGAGCDLVVWPETMLPSGINAEVLDLDVAALDSTSLRSLAGLYFGLQVWAPKYSDTVIRKSLETVASLRREQAASVASMSRSLQCPILAGASTMHRNPTPVDRADRWVMRNSALWFDGSWRADPLYSKRHLVPFSEYVPFKKRALWLHRALRWFVPEVMPQLEPGTDRTIFELSRGADRWRVVSPICYEGVFARICRQLIVQDGAKRADILVNLSNDGWFVWRWGQEPYRASTEQSQHLAQYCFRAVENRVPVVRAVNTGISATIDSNGRILSEITRYGERAMISGTLLLDGPGDGPSNDSPRQAPRVLVDTRTSWYSLHGDVFAILVGVAAAFLAARLWRRRGDNTNRERPSRESR